MTSQAHHSVHSLKQPGTRQSDESHRNMKWTVYIRASSQKLRLLTLWPVVSNLFKKCVKRSIQFRSRSESNKSLFTSYLRLRLLSLMRASLMDSVWAVGYACTFTVLAFSSARDLCTVPEAKKISIPDLVIEKERGNATRVSLVRHQKSYSFLRTLV